MRIDRVQKGLKALGIGDEMSLWNRLGSRVVVDQRCGDDILELIRLGDSILFN